MSKNESTISLEKEVLDKIEVSLTKVPDLNKQGLVYLHVQGPVADSLERYIQDPLLVSTVSIELLTGNWLGSGNMATCYIDRTRLLGMEENGYGLWVDPLSIKPCWVESKILPYYSDSHPHTTILNQVIGLTRYLQDLVSPTIQSYFCTPNAEAREYLRMDARIGISNTPNCDNFISHIIPQLKGEYSYTCRFGSLIVTTLMRGALIVSNRNDDFDWAWVIVGDELLSPNMRGNIATMFNGFLVKEESSDA